MVLLFWELISVSDSEGEDFFLLATLYRLPSMGRTSMLSVLSSAVWPFHVLLTLHLVLVSRGRVYLREWGGTSVLVVDKLLAHI